MTSKYNFVKNFHQNIRGLRSKCNEILCHLEEHTPHVLCFTEHRLCSDEIVHLNLDNYILGAYYSRKHFKKGETCIYAHDSVKIATINLDNFCCDRNIEACAVTINTVSFKICILTIYRSSFSNYKIFWVN
jgi:hypothetical protein